MEEGKHNEEEFVEEKVIEPINVLLSFLVGISAILFVLAVESSFNLTKRWLIGVISAVIVVYTILVVLLLKPKKFLKRIPREKIIEKPIIKAIPVPKTIVRYKEVPASKEIQGSRELKVASVEGSKTDTKEPKYVGSSYTESYHLRECRFSKLIKSEYLLEENDRKYFRLRGYTPCKICKPNRN